MRAHYTPLRFLLLTLGCALLAVAFLLALPDSPHVDPQLTPQTVAPATPYSTEEP